MVNGLAYKELSDLILKVSFQICISCGHLGKLILCEFL